MGSGTDVGALSEKAKVPGRESEEVLLAFELLACGTEPAISSPLESPANSKDSAAGPGFGVVDGNADGRVALRLAVSSSSKAKAQSGGVPKQRARGDALEMEAPEAPGVKEPQFPAPRKPVRFGVAWTI